MNDQTVDLLIIGAGPAGMSAAIEASRLGLRVVVLDEQAGPGGQIYRNIRNADARTCAVLGEDYLSGGELAEAFMAADVDFRPNASVWQVTPERCVHYLIDGRAQVLQARHLLIATGAFERPMPIPGWTLPGVMTAGAGQILLKSAALIPAGPIVLAGCGPLLYLLAVQYLRAGIAIRALVDTGGQGDVLRSWRQLPGALRGWRDIVKGVRLLADLKRAGVRHYRNARHLRVQGEGRATALSFECAARSHTLSASLVLLHQGVVPNTQISWSLRAAHDWNEQQACWVARRDEQGQTSLPGIFIAGDGGSIGGASVARSEGRLVALCIAHRQQRIDQAQWLRLSAPWRRDLNRQRAARPLIDTLYRPQIENRIPVDDVTVCRCEEVTAGSIRQYVDLGCLGPNQTKAFGRCGMGPCQGRMCGLTVTEIIAERRRVSPAQVGYYRIRSPLKPITLSQLADEQPAPKGIH
ncbi:MAG TPA: FAD/NAD(P)-binding oxidoreductase [Pseudomonas sp.]|jgi:NADPH-dependent 2,4-dienoyl-CoA reductase/sulfur reductase-like enzyme